jgi:hypothetical protein
MWRKFLASLAFSAFAGSAAMADVSYEYVAGTSPSGTGPITLSSGGSVTLNLYLVETIKPNTSGQNPNVSLIGQDGGLFAASTQVVGTGTGGTITGVSNNLGSASSTTTFTTALPNNTGFSSTKGTVGDLNNSGSTTYGTAPVGGGTAVTSGTVTNSVLLGTITIGAGTAGTTSTYTVEPYGFGNAAIEYGNTVTQGTHFYGAGNGLDLDSTNNQAASGSPPFYSGANDNLFTFTVMTQSSVPEPGTMILSSLAASMLGFGSWMRRRRGEKTEAPTA